jgi:polyribonucleotide nucleotidyltransferase
MSTIHKVQREIGGRILTIETGKIAKQAHGSVVVQYGETMVLVTAVVAEPRTDQIDYFPLSVEYREKHSAAGKFPGGFMKREGRPSTKEVLTARMIDRPIRPLFPDGYFKEVQIIADVLSADKENNPDILAMIGASAALSISKIPFMGPTGSCRLTRMEGQFIVNPSYEQLEKGDMNVLLGGTKTEINMIEVSAKEVSEQHVADAIQFAHGVVKEVCSLIEELVAKVGVPKVIEVVELNQAILKKVESDISSKLCELKQIREKQARNEAVKAMFDELSKQYCADAAAIAALTPEQAAMKCEKVMLKRIFEKVEASVMRKLMLAGKRPDGRGFNEVRPISCEVGILPRTHGSALFTRGETQALVNVTLGTVTDGQVIDGLLEEYTQNFTLHYNFPPYSVGEVKPFRGPGRREIGHGALAEKALEQVRPAEKDFAYTIRLISDITESNGSSSMASVCGGTLALMDAGVPILNPVAGISIGLVHDENGKYELLTDIIGDEDHFGDMDFKVAGTVKGITAIQLDIKIDGLAHDIMCKAMELAKEARLKILAVMLQTINTPRAELSKYAPKLITIMIDPELIGKVIGPGGKMIKAIQQETGTTIEIEEDGTVFISCSDGESHLKAREIIESLTQPPQIGRVYNAAKVVGVKDFGVFVEISPGVEGLCHISELSDGYLKTVDEVCKMGDIIPVKLISIDDQGRLKLSRKAVLLETGQSERDKFTRKK